MEAWRQSRGNCSNGSCKGAEKGDDTMIHFAEHAVQAPAHQHPAASSLEATAASPPTKNTCGREGGPARARNV
eukprot:15457031-Alexandrium_andersonii.AAC.1